MISNLEKIKETKPLIHCITNPISINDCANAILALGARPIMAEHPKEVEDITKTAKALAVNLGNITDARMESIMLSGKVAKEYGIPSIIDVVGVTCSPLRRDLAKQFIRECTPKIIKGNSSEILSLMEGAHHTTGIDASLEDAITLENAVSRASMIKQFAKETGAVVLVSGKVDLICTGDQAFAMQNGCEMLSKITGTGCMLNAIVATFLAVQEPLPAAICGTAVLGIAGEMSETPKGTGTFKQLLMDALYTMDDDVICKNMKLEEL